MIELTKLSKDELMTCLNQLSEKSSTFNEQKSNLNAKCQARIDKKKAERSDKSDQKYAEVKAIRETLKDLELKIPREVVEINAKHDKLFPMGIFVSTMISFIASIATNNIYLMAAIPLVGGFVFVLMWDRLTTLMTPKKWRHYNHEVAVATAHEQAERQINELEHNFEQYWTQVSAEIKQIEQETARELADLEEQINAFRSNYNLMPQYYGFEHTLAQYLFGGRADTFKEAMDKLEEQWHRDELEWQARQARISAEEAEYAARQAADAADEYVLVTNRMNNEMSQLNSQLSSQANDINALQSEISYLETELDDKW